jgi:hypothetical protein
MASSCRPDPVNVGSSPPFNAQAFFQAIPSNLDRAVAMLQSQVPTDGPPTPRVAEYINNGEWDDDSLLPIFCIFGCMRRSSRLYGYGQCSPVLRTGVY